MQLDDCLLQLLVVVVIFEYLVDILHVVVNQLLGVLLDKQLLCQIFDLVGQTLMPHAQMITNQVELLLDSIVLLQLSMHLVALLAELLDLQLTRADVVSQLIDLEMQHKLELFKLLDLLL